MTLQYWQKDSHTAQQKGDQKQKIPFMFIFWKGQNYKDRKQISGCPSLGDMGKG